MRRPTLRVRSGGGPWCSRRGAGRPRRPPRTAGGSGSGLRRFPFREGQRRGPHGDTVEAVSGMWPGGPRGGAGAVVAFGWHAARPEGGVAAGSRRAGRVPRCIEPSAPTDRGLRSAKRYGCDAGREGASGAAWRPAPPGGPRRCAGIRSRPLPARNTSPAGHPLRFVKSVGRPSPDLGLFFWATGHALRGGGGPAIAPAAPVQSALSPRGPGRKRSGGARRLVQNGSELAFRKR